MFRPMLPVLLLLLAALPVAAASPSPDAANEKARRLIRQTMQDERIPGLQVAVVKDGQVVLSEAFGLANVENGIAATRSTRFPLNSATKAFTGVAAAQLAQQTSWIWKRRWRAISMRCRRPGRTFACANCSRTPRACRTSSMSAGCWAVAPRRRPGRP